MKDCFNTHCILNNNNGKCTGSHKEVLKQCTQDGANKEIKREDELFDKYPTKDIEGDILGR